MNWRDHVMDAVVVALFVAVAFWISGAIDARPAPSHGDSVCLALVKAGVVVSCTYEGEK